MSRATASCSRMRGRATCWRPNAEGSAAMKDLAKAFDVAMLSIHSRAKSEAGYWATAFLGMLDSRGGLQTARQLINSIQAVGWLYAAVRAAVGSISPSKPPSSTMLDGTLCSAPTNWRRRGSGFAIMDMSRRQGRMQGPSYHDRNHSIISPIDGSVYAERPVATDAEVDAAVSAARAAQARVARRDRRRARALRRSPRSRRCSP